MKDFVPPTVPEDLNAAIKSGKVRAPTHIVSTICDDRGEEPTYAGVPMSTIIEKEYGVGDVISLLWFKRSLPRYCTKFIEVLTTTALLRRKAVRPCTVLVFAQRWNEI